MRALLVCGFLTMMIAAPAAAAEPLFPGRFKPGPETPHLSVERKGFSLPVVDYSAPDGSLRRKSGIIAGFEVTPRALLGVGMYQMGVKKRATNGDATLPAKRSRRMAVGLSLQF